jgi:hypothetical protein
MTALLQIFRNFCCSILLLILSGCMVLPLPESEMDRCNISKGTPDQFRPGLTTRREMILVLGEPDYVTIDERKLVYSPVQLIGFWMIFHYAGASGGAICDTDYYVAEFDARGVLIKFEEVKRMPELIPRLTSYAGHNILFQKKAALVKVVKHNFDERLSGALLLSDTELLLFSDSQPLANGKPHLRVPYSTIVEVQLKWSKTKLWIRCESGVEYKFEIYGPKGLMINLDSTAKAYEILNEKTGH